MRNPNWRTHAACLPHDPDLWFTPGAEELARDICMTCPVRQECLIHALGLPERFGVWGASTEEERKRFKFKKMRIRCPQCRSSDVDLSLETVEICRSCGLSWRV